MELVIYEYLLTHGAFKMRFYVSAAYAQVSQSMERTVYVIGKKKKKKTIPRLPSGYIAQNTRPQKTFFLIKKQIKMYLFLILLERLTYILKICTLHYSIILLMREVALGICTIIYIPLRLPIFSIKKALRERERRNKNYHRYR